MCLMISAAVLWLVGYAMGAEPMFDAAQLEFFEKKVRPILVNHCYECHSGEWSGVGRDDLQPDSGGALVHSTRCHHLLDVHQDRQGTQGFSREGMRAATSWRCCGYSTSATPFAVRQSVPW